MGDTRTFKVCYMGYFGIPWIALNEELQSQMSARLNMHLLYISPVKRFNLLLMKTSQKE